MTSIPSSTFSSLSSFPSFFLLPFKKLESEFFNAANDLGDGDLPVEEDDIRGRRLVGDLGVLKMSRDNFFIGEDALREARVCGFLGLVCNSSCDLVRIGTGLDFIGGGFLKGGMYVLTSF